MSFSSYGNTGAFKNNLGEVPSRKNAFLWLLPLLWLWAGWQIFQNYSDYGYMQSIRGVAYERITGGLDKYSIPKTFLVKMKKYENEQQYQEGFRKSAQGMKLYIGFYMALAIISLGLLWKDIISIFGTSVFLLITAVYRLMTAEIPYIDGMLLFILLAIALSLEKKAAR